MKGTKKGVRVAAPPRFSAEAKRAPRGELGWSEPGFDKFAEYRARCGTSAETIEQYAEFLGSVRSTAAGPLLDLSVDELHALDLRLLKKPACFRTVLRMFYKAHRRHDLLDEMPPQRRQKERRLGLEEILTPADVDALIVACASKRDRALVAVLASTGGRINEVLRLRIRDLRQSNGGAYQAWFGTTKVRGEERYSPKIEGPWKGLLDEWLAVHPVRNDPAAWLFPSSVDLGIHVNDATIGGLLRTLAKHAEISKPVNPHAFRHARVTWGVIRGEDRSKLSMGIWGKELSSMINTYSAYDGLDVALGAPAVRVLKDVPPLPAPPMLATQARVADLEVELQRVRKEVHNELLIEMPKQILERVAAMFAAEMKVQGKEVVNRPLTSEERASGKYASALVQKETSKDEGATWIRETSKDASESE